MLGRVLTERTHYSETVSLVFARRSRGNANSFRSLIRVREKGLAFDARVWLRTANKTILTVLAILPQNESSVRALLGLEAPIRIAPTSPDGERPYNPQEAEQIVALLSDDELALLHKVYCRMQEIATSNGQSKN